MMRRRRPRKSISRNETAFNFCKTPGQAICLPGRILTTTGWTMGSYWHNLREYIEALDKAGKLQRVTTPINKDTELHPLVRLQFRGSAREPAQGLPVRERGRCRRPQARHPGDRRRPRRLGGHLCHGHALRSQGHRKGLEERAHQPDPAQGRRQGAVPGSRHHRRRTKKARRRPWPAADPDLDARVSTTPPTPPPATGSPKIRTPACTTWATTAAR